MAWLDFDQHLLAALLLLGGVLGVLVAVLACGGPGLALAGASPRRRAIVHWLPIATVAIVCTLLGHGEMGIGVVYGTSVAALSAVTGFVILARPLDELPAPAARVWSFLPVAATLAFVIGFKPSAGPFEAAVLLIQGLLVAMIWPRRMADPETADEPSLFVAEPKAPAPSSLKTLVRIAECLAALALAGVAGWAATRGAVDLGLRDLRYSTHTVAATLLGVALAMPLIGMGVPLASEGRTWVPLTAQVGLVYLNLCLLLPVLILLTGVVHHVSSLPPIAATLPTAPVAWESILYPRITWRIDALATVILSLLFVPIAAGRLKLDGHIAGWLITGYCAYLIVSIITSGMLM